MIRTGLVGAGYWGPNLIRNLRANENFSLEIVCDLSPSRLKKTLQSYPQLQPSQDYRELVRDPTLDLIVIATPVNTHYPIASEALRGGKHVLLTKPMAMNEQECLRLIELADTQNKVLMVDHTFVYHPAVQYLKRTISQGHLGKLLCYHSSRMNLGLYQPDVSVIYDLMPHDLSILNELVREEPEEIVAVSDHAARLPQADIAYLQLRYRCGLLAAIHASWLSPNKVRNITITGSRQMVVYDDVDVVQKIKIYDKGIEAENSGSSEDAYTKFLQYRQGDILSPSIPTTEALATEIEHLAECITQNKRPLTCGYQGLRTVKLLQYAEQLAHERKNWIKVPQTLSDTQNEALPTSALRRSKAQLSS